MQLHHLLDEDRGLALRCSRVCINTLCTTVFLHEDKNSQLESHQIRYLQKQERLRRELVPTTSADRFLKILEDDDSLSYALLKMESNGNFRYVSFLNKGCKKIVTDSQVCLDTEGIREELKLSPSQTLLFRAAEFVRIDLTSQMNSKKCNLFLVGGINGDNQG